MNNTTSEMPFKLAFTIYLIFFISAVLLSSTGIVVMEMINTLDVSKESASYIEIIKDAAIIITALGISAFIPNFGYKKTLIASTLLMGIGTLSFIVFDSFASALVLFLILGLSFMLCKTSIYAVIRKHAKNDRQHAKDINVIEGFFAMSMVLATLMFGISISLFSSWKIVFQMIVPLCIIALFMLLNCDIDDKVSERISYSKMWKLLQSPTVIAFGFCTFFYAFLEQGISTWIPTLNNEVFHLTEGNAASMASLWPLSIAIGRIGWALIMQYTQPSRSLYVMILMGSVWLAGVIYAIDRFAFSVVLFPLIGLFVGAILPTLSAAVLQTVEENMQGAMTGWIVVFYAIGGAVGSRVLAVVYQEVSGAAVVQALYIPLGLLLVGSVVFMRVRGRSK